MFTRVFLILFYCSTTNSAAAQLKRFSFTVAKMGSPFTIVMYCNDSLTANTVATKCFNLVDSFVFIFSDYIDTSELSRLSNTAGPNMQPVKVSPALMDLLMASKMAFEKSSGAFDITIGPLVKYWRKARKTTVFPTDTAVQNIKCLTGFNKMLIDTVNKTATLLQQGMQLDLGGIAQGYIAQQVMLFLQRQLIGHALINVSGDIVVGNAPPGSKGWSVGINVPESQDELLLKTLLLQNKAVATSGDAYQFMQHGGKRYSHIIDPRTGYGVTSQRNVTVIASDGTTADWLATACSILPVNKAKRLAKQMGAEVLIGEIKKGKLVFNATKGFSIYWKHP